MTVLIIISALLLLAFALAFIKLWGDRLAILGLAFIVGITIFGLLFWHSRQSATSLRVVGYASKLFESDLVKWNLTFQKNIATAGLSQGYRDMTKDINAFREYITQEGIPEADISVMPVTSYPRYDYNGNMVGYVLNQRISILSMDLDKIGELSLNPDFFAERGMMLNDSGLEYLYTKLPELKQQLLSEATSDALARAREISGAAHTKLGKMQEARAGVFQITEPYSTDVSDYGIYNTSTRKKSISVTLSGVFKLRGF